MLLACPPDGTSSGSAALRRPAVVGTASNETVGVLADRIALSFVRRHTQGLVRNLLRMGVGARRARAKEERAEAAAAEAGGVAPLVAKSSSAADREDAAAAGLILLRAMTERSPRIARELGQLLRLTPDLLRENETPDWRAFVMVPEDDDGGSEGSASDDDDGDSDDGRRNPLLASLRVHFVELVFAFVAQEGSAVLARDVVHVWSSVYADALSGVAQDPPAVAASALDALHNGFVRGRGRVISKKAKAAFFTPEVLDSLVALFDDTDDTVRSAAVALLSTLLTDTRTPGGNCLF